MKSALFSDAVAVPAVVIEVSLFSKRLVCESFYSKTLTDFSSEIKLGFLAGGALFSLLEMIPEKVGLVVVRMPNLELFLIE